MLKLGRALSNAGWQPNAEMIGYSDIYDFHFLDRFANQPMTEK